MRGVIFAVTTTTCLLFKLNMRYFPTGPSECFAAGPAPSEGLLGQFAVQQGRAVADPAAVAAASRRGLAHGQAVLGRDVTPGTASSSAALR